MYNPLKSIFHEKVVKPTSEKVDKKFQDKVSIRHAFIAGMITVLTLMGYQVADFARTQKINEAAFIFWAEVLVFLAAVYIGVTTFEFLLHYTDMSYFNRISVPKTLKSQVDQAIEDIKKNALAQSEIVIKQVVDTGIMKYLKTTAEYVSAINATNTNPIEQAIQDAFKNTTPPEPASSKVADNQPPAPQSPAPEPAQPENPPPTAEHPEPNPPPGEQPPTA